MCRKEFVDSAQNTLKFTFRTNMDKNYLGKAGKKYTKSFEHGEVLKCIVIEIY